MTIIFVYDLGLGSVSWCCAPIPSWYHVKTNGHRSHSFHHR